MPNIITNFSEAFEPRVEARDITAQGLCDMMDTAEAGDLRRLFALYRDVVGDSHVFSEFSKRKDSILGDTWSVTAADPAATALITPLIKSAMFRSAVSHLLNASLYPLAVVEKVFAPTATGFEVVALVPVPFHLLDFTTGPLRIRDTDANGEPLDDVFHAPDPQRYIVHRGHDMPLPDRWGGPMRGVLAWWLFRVNSRQWWADLLERFGVPFTKAKYNDPTGKQQLIAALQLFRRLGALVISKNTEVEIVQATTGDSSGSHEKFLAVCNAEISKLIVGQTLTTTSAPLGLGGGAAPVQQDVLDNIRRKDAVMLASTLRDQLFAPLASYNGLIASPEVLFGADTVRETNRLVSAVGAIHQAGLEPEDDALVTISAAVGFRVRRMAAPAAPSTFPMSAPVPPVSTTSLADFISRTVNQAANASDAMAAITAWVKARPDIDLRHALESTMEAYAARALTRPDTPPEN